MATAEEGRETQPPLTSAAGGTAWHPLPGGGIYQISRGALASPRLAPGTVRPVLRGTLGKDSLAGSRMAAGPRLLPQPRCWTSCPSLAAPRFNRSPAPHAPAATQSRVPHAAPWAAHGMPQGAGATPGTPVQRLQSYSKAKPPGGPVSTSLGASSLLGIAPGTAPQGWQLPVVSGVQHPVIPQEVCGRKCD